MKRKLLAAMLSLVMLLTLLPTTAFAVTDEVTVDSYEALTNALVGDAATIKLGANIESNSGLIVASGRNVTIDLNGHSITRNKTFDNNFYYKDPNSVATAPTLMVRGTLELKDSGSDGSVNSTIQVSDGIVTDKYSVRNCAVWVDGGTFRMESGIIRATTNGDATIGVYMTKSFAETEGTFTMNGGTIDVGTANYLGTSYGVYVGGSTNKATFNMTNGTINAVAQVVLPNADGSMSGSTGDAHGVHVDGNGNDQANGVFTMTGGQIISKGFGISGDDECGGTDIDVTNARIEGYAVAIYHPQAGTLDITNSTLTGTTGLEAKGGTIHIKDGSFNSLLEQGQGGRTYGDEQNHGNSTKGWAVAAVNNTYYRTDGVSITIDGGTYTAPVGVLDDSVSDTDSGHSYKIIINGGTFKSLVRMYGYDTKNYTTYQSNVEPATTDSIVINGGSFAHDPMYHVADNKTAVKDTSGYHKVVDASTIETVAEKAPTCTDVGNAKYYIYKEDNDASPVPCYQWGSSYDYDRYMWSNDDIKPFYVYYTDTAYLISANGHTWKATSRVEPTEEVAGSISYVCSVCEQTKSETLEPNGVHHDTSEQGTLQHHDAVAANCATLTNGIKEYWTCSNDECEGKKFVKNTDDTFTEVRDEELVIPYEHTIEKLTGKDATCTETGLTEGEKCTTCNMVIKPQSVIPVKGHTRGAKTTETTPATSETDGTSYEVIRCSDCNEVLSKTVITIPAGHEHAWDEGVVTTQPTTTSTGVKTYTCKNCHVTKTEVIAKLPSGGSSSGSSGSSGTTTYKVTTSAVSNGSVKTSVSAAAKGATVTLTLSPDKGYTLDKLTVTDASGNSISTTKKSDTVYTFTMPASQVKVGVTYVKEDSTVVEPTTSFTDVTSTDWFAEAVKYVADKGMMNGTSKTTFGPKSGTTRGMIVTVLYRLENEPSTSATSFTDVASDAYYANAVAWANANSVVSGYGNGKFGPNDSITREQLAAILYRYAQYKKYNVSVGEDTNIMDFDDVRQISSYAVPAIQWACGAGVMTGKSTTTLDPKGGATRAEVAAMLMRFCENVK